MFYVLRAEQVAGEDARSGAGRVRNEVYACSQVSTENSLDHGAEDTWEICQADADLLQLGPDPPG